MGNSIGNTDRDVRKFLREQGMKANAENVDRIGRELRRTQQENERHDERYKDVGLRDAHLPGSPDTTGPVDPRVRERIQRELKRRKRG